jgi:hypothetical protein
MWKDKCHRLFYDVVTEYHIVHTVWQLEIYLTQGSGGLDDQAGLKDTGMHLARVYVLPNVMVNDCSTKEYTHDKDSGSSPICSHTLQPQL